MHTDSKGRLTLIKETRIYKVASSFAPWRFWKCCCGHIIITILKKKSKLILTWGARPKRSKRAGSHQKSDRSARPAPPDAAATFSSSGSPSPDCCSGPLPCGYPGVSSVATPGAPAPACALRGCAWTGPHSLSFYCAQICDIDRI